jgi:DNA-directed RNA polymerase subunit omega
MIYPSISRLLEVIDSRYTLVVATAKRARKLAEGEPALVRCESQRPVTIAVNEIAQNKIRYTRNKPV